MGDFGQLVGELHDILESLICKAGSGRNFVLKRAAQVFFLIVMSLFWHSNANAQSSYPDASFGASPITELSYPQRTEAFRLAAAGDRDAFFQLGVSYLYGLNSVQNSKVAERFFFYAAQKGHLEANSYLSLAQASNDVPQAVKTAEIPASRQNIQKTSYSPLENTQQANRAEKLRLKAEKKALAKQKREAARLRRAKAKKKKARLKEEALMQEGATITPTSASGGTPGTPATLDVKTADNPYVPGRTSGNLKLMSGLKGLFFLLFWILSLGIYVSLSYMVKHRRSPAALQIEREA